MKQEATVLKKSMKKWLSTAVAVLGLYGTVGAQENRVEMCLNEAIQVYANCIGNGSLGYKEDPSAKAVDLIGEWVEAGAPNGEFKYKSINGEYYTGSFEQDILPLFTTPGVWYEGARACASCHNGNTENSYHEMDLSSYEGIMKGGDVLSEPPGVPLFGQSAYGAQDYDWAHSKMRARLRNNRMPPGWPEDLSEVNRDGPCVEVTSAGVTIPGAKGKGAHQYGCDLNAVGLLEAWVAAGAEKTASFSYGGQQVNFEHDVKQLFTEGNTWYSGSAPCSSCHFGNSELSYHEMDLSSYEGIMKGGDVLSEPPGVPLFGQSAVGATDYDWDHSKMRERLRNNRMPIGIAFDITEENRDGPLVLHGKAQ
jgi:hypothetical protein